MASTGSCARCAGTRTGCGSKFEASQDIPYPPCHAYAELIGLKGIKVERSAPEEPPIPPHVTFEQMEALTKAFAGAPREGLPGVMEAAREFVKEFKPGE